jgi:hypothetical protein
MRGPHVRFCERREGVILRAYSTSDSGGARKNSCRCNGVARDVPCAAIGGKFDSGAVFKPPARVAGLDDIAMMGQPVEHGCGHFGVAEDLGPVGKGEIGGDQ